MHGAESEIRFIVRQAGLPADSVAPFRSEACRDQLERIRVLSQQNQARRAALVAALEGIIGGAPEASRHFWLAIKRDCWNGRSLARYAADPAFGTTPAEIRDGCTEVDAGERAIERAVEEFEALFASEKRREARDLLAYLDDPRFLRGVAMSSGSLTDYLPRLLGRQVEDYGRREHRLASSLIRYVTRAALKLSPFSTLTCVGLGRLFEPPPDPSAPQLATAADWREGSQVRMQRFRVDQVLAMLTRHPPLRGQLPLALNPTVEEVDADGRFLYMKGPTWDLDPETGLLRAAPYSIVTVRLRGPFVRWLRERLAGGSLPYREAASSYRAERPAAAAADLESTLDRLLEIGFLEFASLWHIADPYPEKRLLETLGVLPPDEALAPLMAALAGILEGEAGYSRAADPFALAQELRRRVRGTLGHAAALAGFDSGIATRGDHRSLHEDVFLEAAGAGGTEPEIARLATGQYREIVDNLQLFARLSNVRTSQVEFLHSAAAFATEKWPGGTSVPFYEFFEAVNPLFGAYSKHEQSSLKAPAGAVPFNPYQLETLERLHQARLRLSAELPGCLEDGDEEAVLDRDAVLRLIDDVPAPYNRPRDFCAIVQPLDDRASSWALNMMAEGKGRLSSRFTATMETAMRQSLAQPFVDASRWTENGREVELVDLYCSAGHSANVHAPITRRVLQLPGNSSGLPAERHLRLCDLRVAWQGREQLPELVDQEGRKILPAHLGSVATVHMPRLVRLLATFGPGGFYFRRPTLPARDHGGTSEVKRHRIGNVVYRRHTWLVPPAPLAAALSGLRGPAAHRYLDDWRRVLRMPERVYAHEAIAIGPSPYTKPQYVDFTSPHLVEIFCAILKAEIPRLQIVEALPAPERQHCGNAGLRRAIEVHLESI